VTAKEKQTILKQWVLFCKAISEGDQFVEYTDPYGNVLPVATKRFTKRLYTYLTLYCSFIAHYDIWGFYQTYFIKGEQVERFFRQFDAEAGCISVEYGGTGWKSGDCADLNSALIEEAKPFLKKIYIVSGRAQKDRDVAQAKELLKKHGYDFKEE
jgi:hypothetical protein